APIRGIPETAVNASLRGEQHSESVGFRLGCGPGREWKGVLEPHLRREISANTQAAVALCALPGAETSADAFVGREQE
ncbi:MAG: hypothetical protein ABR860_06850, partial [Terracidiphilus sp.]